MEDNYSKLYRAMVNSGYDAADLGGNEEEFRSAMQDSTMRKNFYDWASKNEKNGFRIGSYESYEARLAPAAKPSPAPLTPAAEEPRKEKAYTQVPALKAALEYDPMKNIEDKVKKAKEKVETPVPTKPRPVQPRKPIVKGMDTAIRGAKVGFLNGKADGPKVYVEPDKINEYLTVAPYAERGAYNEEMARAIKEGRVMSPEEMAEVDREVEEAAKSPEGVARMVDAAKEYNSFDAATLRANSKIRGQIVEDDAAALVSGLYDAYAKERKARQEQVEKDVESYNSAREWDLNPYAEGTEALSEAMYRSNATTVRDADELGMIAEFAEDAKAKIMSDKDMRAKAEENAALLDMPLDKYVNEIAVPVLQSKMYGAWLAPQEGRMRKNYNGIMAAVENSLFGTLFGFTRTDTERYLSQVGQEEWNKNASLWGKAAAGAGGMLLDLPAFIGLGSLAAAPTKAVGSQVFKQLAKNETKRLVARGVAETAAKRYANIAVRNGLKNRILMGLATAPLQGGLTFGMFDAGKTALNMSLNGEWDWSELGKSAVGGTLLGGALGVVGATGGALTHGLRGGTKVAAKVAEFGVENAVFTEGGRLIGKLHGQQPENGWLEDYVESGATLLMLKAPNIVKNVSRIKGDKEASEVFAFNRLEREQLGKYGKDLNAVLEEMLPKGEKMAVEGEKVSLDGVNEGVLTEQYVAAMNNPEIPLVTKAKLMAVVEGKVMPAPRVVDAQIEGNRVMTYDPMGRLVETKEYATEAKAKTEYEKVADKAEVESIAVLEDMYVRLKGYEADDATVKEWFAKNPDVKAEDVARIVAKDNVDEPLTKAEQKILDSLRKARREGLNDISRLQSLDLTKYDIQEKDLLAGLAKPANERTDAENKAVNAYREALTNEVQHIFNARKLVTEAEIREQRIRTAEDVERAAEGVRRSQDGVKMLADRMAESDARIDETANDGMVYTTTNNNGEKIIITGGKVVLDNEGFIDVNQSEGLVALMPDGTKKPVRVDELREKVEVSNAEELKAAKREEIKQEVAVENGWKVLEPGADIEIAFDGDVYKLKVQGRDERGDVILSGEGESMAVPESLVQEGMKEAERLRNAEVASPTAEEAATIEGGEAKAESSSPVEAPFEQPELSNGLSNAEQLPKEKQESAPIPTEKRGKTTRAAYHLVPIKRTMEDLYDGTLEPEEVEGLINARIKEAESDLKALEGKKPVIGADKNTYVAAKQQWQADMEAARAKLDYYNQLKAINAEVARSEMREAVEEVKPRETVEMTADEFVANQLGNFVKITPESFQKETGLKAEQKQLVGVIAGTDKGGVSVERAAEQIMENFGDELRGLGFNGDMQDMRDMIINILSNGNPRSYAKKGAEMRAQADIEHQRSELEGVAAQLGFDTIEEQIEYEEAVVPRIIQDYTGFDETEYFNNLAENYEYDTTRESEGTRGGSELLQGEQPVNNAGVGDIAEQRPGGEVQGDVYSGGENAATQGNQQVTAPVGEITPTAEEVADAQVFADASALNTLEAYQDYLDNHPEGAYREGARAGMWMIEGINPETHGRNAVARNAANAVLARVEAPQATNKMQEAELTPAVEPVGNSEQEKPTQKFGYRVGQKVYLPRRGSIRQAEILEFGDSYIRVRYENIDGETITMNFAAEYFDKLKKQAEAMMKTDNDLVAEVQAAEAEVNTAPTDKQKEAGNYKKGHVQIGAFNITIEQPRGSVRSGVDKGGKKWKVEMQNTYGYIRGTEGVDGDHIDVFLSNDIGGWNGRQVYIIDQRNADGSFDEHKVMLGFNDINEAEEAYLSNYEQGWQGLGAITGVATKDFEKWIASSHRKTKAFSEYKSIKTTEGQSAPGKSGVQQNESRKMYSPEELAQAKEQFGELNATSAPEFAARLFSIKPWKTLEEANAALKELLASYGETLNGQTAAVLPFLDKAQGLISEYNKSQEPRLVEEILENGDKRITNYNSRGEVATVAIERDGKVVSVDSYDEGVLFEHTEYDGNGKAASVTRYDKQGNVVGTQKYVDGKAVLYSISEDAMLKDKGTEAFERATENVRKKLEATGVKVVKATKKMADALIKGSAEGLTADELHELRGVVARGLADAEVKIVRCGNNPFNTKQKTVDLKKEVLGYAEKNGILGTMSNEETNGKGEIRISKNSIGKFVDDSASDKSVDKDIHLSVLPQIREVIASSIETEVHPDYIKVGKDRSRENGYNKNVLIHRCYGAVNIDGKVYRVKITLKEDISHSYAKAYSYEVTNIELLEGTDENAVAVLSQQDNSITVAKLLENVEKSYDDGVKLLSASKNAPDFMTVFHGSGAKFDKFDHSFMGTGEGAQAYGWGTYVTEVEGIGRTYATTMRDKNISEKHKENAIINNLARQVLTSNNGDKNAALEELRNLLNESWSDKKRVKAEIKIIETGKFLPETKVKANLYTVEIPDDNGTNYLHWREPINGEIQERVANGLQNIGFEIEPNMNHLAYSRDEKFAVLNINASGADLYAELSEALGGDKAASEFLNDIGFVGISYPANATTGGRKDGARNYVIFNENDAQIEDRVEFLRTANGKVYGWAVNGTIYLMPDGINPNTPIHEYTHLWAAALQKSNPKLWGEVVEAMKLSPAWNEVMADDNYTDIHGDENRVASEVLSRLSGNEGYRRYMEQAEAEIAAEKNLGEKVRKKGILNRIRNAVSRFWNWLKGKLGSKAKAGDGTEAKAEPWDVFVNKSLKDFDEGVNPDAKDSPLDWMFIGKKGAANLDKAEEATTRLDNLAVAREMETGGKDAKAIKLATGWERGADGKWRYETEDLINVEAVKKLAAAANSQGILSMGVNTNLKSILKQGNNLLVAYPELSDMKVVFKQMGAYDGYYDKANNTLAISSSILRKENKIAEALEKAKIELEHWETMDDAGKELASFMEVDYAEHLKKLKNNVLELEKAQKELPSLIADELNGIAVHEIQHAIQHIEGFATGGNENTSDWLNEKSKVWTWKKALDRLAEERPDIAGTVELEKALVEEYKAEGLASYIPTEEQRIKGFNLYARGYDNEGYESAYNESIKAAGKSGRGVYNDLAGEVEARSAQKRMNYTEEQRRNELATETEDVRREDQIFLEKNLGVSASQEVAPEQDIPLNEVKSKPISRIDLSNGPVKGVNEPEWKFKARREKWRRWVESNTNVKTPMPEKPFLQEGESIEEYATRMKEFNKELNKWKKDILSNESEIEKMMDLLYDGKIPEMSPTPEDEFTEQVFKRYMGDDGIKVDRKSMRGMIMDEIIERRRKIETNNFDDVVFIDKVRKATTAEQRKAIPFIIEGTYNGKLSPELASVVNRIRDWFENVYQALQAADAMHSSGKISNYVTHIWDKARTPKAVYENYINTRSKYTNRRSIETYAEGIALGMVPKYDDICDIMLEYGHIANEAIANKDFIDFLHMLRVDGEPVLKDAAIRDPMYVRISVGALDEYKVHRYAKNVVETVLGNVRTENAGPILRGLAHFYDMTGSLMKKINLSLSFFHHGALIETAVGAMGPAKTISTTLKNLVWDCMRSGELPALSNPEAARNAVNHLVQLGATQDYMAKEVNRLTGQLKGMLQDFSDKHPNFATKSIVKPAELLDFLNTGFDKVLWDYLHDGLKIYTFDKYAKEIEEYCKQKGVDDTTKDMLLNEAGQFVNDTFGGQFWELIHWSPATVKWMRRLLLSPDWTTSTIRQALAPLGFGTLYKDYEKNWFKRTFSGIPEAVTQRRKMGAKFWIIAMLTFVPLMNALNAWRRKDDVDEELRKAEERRKTDPEYKSPYELKYPEGMKWYDYTMYGNTIGHQTHLFGWRYDDGKEGYIRWGKQFRELPELFLGKDGFSFPGPMIDKMVGKMNPALSASLAFLGYAKDGWQSKWMKDKKGWEKELGRVMMMASAFMPYSIPTDEDKEFMLTDLMMPSSKGFSNNKAIREFETAILAQDFDYVGKVYDACAMNKLDAEKLLRAAIARVETQAKAEYVEGANTLEEAWAKYQEDLDVNEKRAVRAKFNRLLQENAYKDFEKQEARDMVQSVLDGTYREEKLPDAYIASETAEDVRDAYKMDSIRLRLKKVVDDIPEDAEAYKLYYEDNRTKIDLYDEVVAARREINLIMEDINIYPQQTELFMQEIRDIRKEVIESANNLTSNNE